ncbi:MAG TPA: HAD family phosphatase [Verrucomicrobiae bacterium]|nr:HAD family phosphatase [Verrucomicrobiae bacterium]
MNDIDAVIFDLGNVLLAVDEARAAERLAARTGKSLQQIILYARSTPHADDLGLGKLSRQQFFEIVSRDLAFDGSYAEFAAIWAEIFTPIKPMIALAESLKNRVRRLVLSNTNAIHMDYILERFPFLNDFDGLVLSFDVGLLKPDPGIYKYALEKYRLTPGRTVFIDDMAVNVEAARGIGLQVIQFCNADQARAELTKLGLSPI